MTLTPDDLIEDENYSQFWREQVETPNALDNAFPYSVALDDVLGDICPKDTALDSFWLSDIDPDPWIPDDQRLNKISTLEVIEDHNHDGQIESGLSTSSSSNLSTPSLEGDCSRLVDIPLKNVEPNGAQWEHVENVQLEPNPDEILRRRSLDSLRAEPVPSADREAIKNNRSKSTTQAELLKPRRRRGRKPSNLSPEEKRRRRLERGRLAANKCRRKKRELENMLELRAKNLLAERNNMLQINNELRIEMQSLVDEVMNHSNAACGGISEAAGLLANAPEFKSTSQCPQVVDLEQTLAGAGLCPTQPGQSGSPGRLEAVSKCSLDTFSLDPGSPCEMMDFLLASRP